MGNQSNVDQTRRYQQEPSFCCGNQPRQQKYQQTSQNVSFEQNTTSSKFHKSKSAKNQKSLPNLRLKLSGELNLKEKECFEMKKQSSQQKNTGFNNTGTEGSKQQSNQNSIRILTKQSDLKKSGFASFKKPAYGAYNSGRNNSHVQFQTSQIKQTKQPKQQEIQQNHKPLQNNKPIPVTDFHGQQDIRNERFALQQRNRSVSFIGQNDKYGGKRQDFTNNKRIIQFLTQNKLKNAGYKFYDTTDTSSLLNNSTIGVARHRSRLSIPNLQQVSYSQIHSQTLNKLQQPIELTLQIDAKIILATCLLIIGVIIVIIGGTVVYSDTNIFICVIIGVILYVCYLIICYIYNDVLTYLFNTRSFQHFQKDYQIIRKTQGQFAYHLHYQTKTKVMKQCYLLAKENKFTKIINVNNQNRDISIKQLKDQRVSFLLVKYKTKISFSDSQSQLNTIKYFDEFLNEHKNMAQFLNDKKEKKGNKYKQQIQNQVPNKKPSQNAQKYFKNAIIKSDFSYELDFMADLTKKPQSEITICYMDDDDNGCIIFLFIFFTLIGFCLPFLCFFQAYTKRYRLNILNRFRIG